MNWTLRNEAEINMEAVCYWLISPDRTDRCLIYSEEEIVASGGIHSIEGRLMRESYWFARLGSIQGQVTQRGRLTFSDQDIASLPLPQKEFWKIGHRNPAYSAGFLERECFLSLFLAISEKVASWKDIDEDGIADKYTLKELLLDSGQLNSICRGLQTLRQVHEIVRVTVIKYWYCESSTANEATDDTTLASFSFLLPVQIEIGYLANPIIVRVPDIHTC